MWEHTVNNSSDNNKEQKSDIESDSSERPKELSNKHFLIYWQERNVRDHEASGYPLDVVSSRQLKRAKSNDTLWFSTINQAGELILAGRLRIGEIVDHQTAIRRLNDTFLWDGGFFALPKENEAEILRRINLSEAALDLRFANTESDRFVLKNGKINPQQLQSMRELTEESAEMLARIWETEEAKNDDFTVDLDESDEEGNWAERLQHFRQLVRDEPDNAEAHFNLGEACEMTRLRKEANQAYQRAIELDPNYIGAYCNLGQNYLYDNKLDKSEQAFKTAIRLAPEYAPPRFMLGEVYAKLGDFEKAIAISKEGLEYDLDDPTAYFNLGYYYFHLQDYENAGQWFEKSAKLAPDYRTTFYRLGECYRHLGEKKKEFDAYWRVLELSPDFNAFALFALGTAYAHLTETAEGKRVAYFEAGGVDSTDPQALFHLGLGYLGLGKIECSPGRLEAAREILIQLSEMDASVAKQLQFFIDRFEEEPPHKRREVEGNNWTELLESLRQLVGDEPHNADAHYNFGVACDENDLPEEANAAYRKTIELDPDYLGAYYNLGCNYLRSGELDKSEQSFEAAIRLAPEFAPARFMLGVVYGELGNFERAINTTKEGLELDPEDPKGYFNVGNFYSLLRDYKKAAEWFEKSAEIEPNEPVTFYRLGKCYRELGKKEKEFDAYLQAVELAPDFADALFALGTVYAHLTGTEEGKRVAYFETGGELILSDSRVSFYLGLGNLAIGNVDEVRESQNDLRKMDERLADQLQFFIDRYEPEIEETEVAVKESEAKPARKKREPIEFYINEERFEAKNIPEIYQQALEYLVGAGLLGEISLPVATGEKRYILANKPIHPTGKSFLAPVEYKGFFMEAHNNRSAAIAQLRKLIESAGGTFGEIINFNLEMDDEPEELNLDAEKLKKFQGCLLGGAVGDALGAAIEFDSIERIRQKFGEQGLTDYAPAYGRIGAITDDTQMTMFTAEGLLRAITRQKYRELCGVSGVIYHAYMRWLETQGVKLNNERIKSWVYDTQSWLRDLPELNSRRAPGNSCLSALQSGRMGEIEQPINNSKGCGGVMRVAPVGLIANDPFSLASEAAAITHGHPTGYLSAGVLAVIINQIIEGKSLPDAVNHAVYEILPQHANYEETFAACDKAIKLANDQTIQPAPETIETLGQGWIAEEALAISIYCSLACENDFKKAVLLAVNHSGDSDSTGAITGNILGALHGTEAIPENWLARLELKEAISEIARDLLIGFRTGDDWGNKYPGV